MTDEKEKSGKEGPRNFGVTLAELDGGQVLTDLGISQQEVLSKLQDVALDAGKGGKAKGELTLKLRYTVESNGVLMIATEITTKTPKIPRNSSMGWVTKGGNVTFDNPRQKSLDFRDVSAPKPVEDVLSRKPIVNN